MESDVWPEMFDEVDEKQYPGPTCSKLNDIVPGHLLQYWDQSPEYRGIIAVGEALSTVSVRL